MRAHVCVHVCVPASVPACLMHWCMFACVRVCQRVSCTGEVDLSTQTRPSSSKAVLTHDGWRLARCWCRWVTPASPYVLHPCTSSRLLAPAKQPPLYLPRLGMTLRRADGGQLADGQVAHDAVPARPRSGALVQAGAQPHAPAHRLQHRHQSRCALRARARHCPPRWAAAHHLR